MANSSPKVMAENILEKIGGKDNISSLGYCATRLRIILKDNQKANIPGLKKIDGVMGVVEQAGQMQLILGPGVVGKVANELKNMTGIEIGEVDEVAMRKEELKIKNSTPFKLFLRKLSNIFVPLIPGFVGCGIIYGVSKLLNSAGLIDKNLYNMLYVIGKSVFLYMNIIVGINTAKEFGGSPTLGGCIAGILSSPKLANIVLNGEKLVPEEGGIIAVLLACWFGAWLEKKLRKVMPSVIDLMVTPTLVLLIVGFGSIFVFHPLGAFLTEGLTKIVTVAIEKGSVITGAILSGTFLPLVMTGLHRALTPVETSLLKATQIDMLRPILAMAGAGQVGAGIAIYVKTKNKKLKNIIASSLPVGMLGIGEPLMFGVTLPLGKPFLTACLGSMFGGAYVAAMGVGSTGLGLSGLPLLVLMPSGKAAFHYLIGTLISYAGGFVLTYFTKWEDDVIEYETDNPMSKIGMGA